MEITLEEIEKIIEDQTYSHNDSIYGISRAAQEIFNRINQEKNQNTNDK